MIGPLQEQLTGAQYCSYRVGGPLDAVYFPKTVDEAQLLLAQFEAQHQAITVFGGGSNSIIASNGIRGATILLKRLMFIEQMDSHRFQLGAGLPLAKVCKLAQEHQLTGVEFMIGVPGTLGGAIAMNAGAMGQETAEVIEYAIVYNLLTQSIEHWGLDRLDFSYRHSAIDPKQVVVLGAQVTLAPGQPEIIADSIKKSLVFRQTHHPKEPNGGSVFKNPTKEHPAGWMLDQLGAKGWVEGGAAISPMHANFIVNREGQATSTDILRLMLKMKRAIKAAYGYDVTPENRFIGDASAEEINIWEELTGEPYHA